MTSEEKREAVHMRQSGQSYSKIAAALGVSENTIKSFCRRNAVDIENKSGRDENGDHTLFCRQCGALLKRKGAGRPRKFCSDACRRMWWKANKNRLNKQAYYTLTCAGCGIQFKSYGNRNRKFCSHPCFIKNRFQKGAD